VSELTERPPSSESAANSQQQAHPIWCDRHPGHTWPVCTAFFGQVELSDRHLIEVELVQYSGGRRPGVVAVVERLGDDETVRDMTAAQARELARWLHAAADILDASSPS
jgi:hypothetical protein